MGRYISNSFGSCKGGYVLPFGGGSVPVDPDAEAFIIAADITDPTEQSAINQLVIDLKSYNVWVKMLAIYPFVGGTSSTCSYNLKDPSQFQITWYGGMTFASTGVTSNGVNGYGDTGINENSNFTSNDEAISIYSRSSFTDRLCAIGVYDGNGSYIFPKYGNTYYGNIQGSGLPAITSFEDSLGMFTVNRDDAFLVHVYKNGSFITSQSSAFASKCNLSFYLGAMNFNNSPVNFMQIEMAFSFLGVSLTDTEVANIYTSVQAFQTTLSRQV